MVPEQEARGAYRSKLLCALEHGKNSRGTP